MEKQLDALMKDLKEAGKKLENTLVNRELGLDQFHMHEALDRTYMAVEMWENHIAEHVAVLAHPDLKAMAEEIADKMRAMYQAIGRIS